MDASVNDLIKKGKKAAFFTSVQPMLATLVDKPFEKEGWTYEVKWDGYRAIAFMNNSQAELRSRNDKSFSIKFYPVQEALLRWGINAVVDGEVVVTNKNGISDFGALQNWRSEADGELIYYVFDVLWYNGFDLKHLPFHERKTILTALMPEDPHIRLSNDFDTDAAAFLEQARKLGLEGIMAKKADSAYIPGNRSKDWLKIKANKRQEVVIGGYTLNDGSHKPFSSLLVGVYNNGRFIYTGRIGTGFNTKTQLAMLEQFEPFITNESPFEQKPDVNKPSRFRPAPPNASVVWLKPKLICEVSFTELTRDGIMRHPSFEGMRTDKEPDTVVLEKEVSVQKVVEQNDSTKKSTAAKAKKKVEVSEILQPVSENRGHTLLNPSEKTQVKEINGRQLKFSNLGKLYWPDEKVTKRDLINYYYLAAPFILPYVKDRPMTLKRYPNGIHGMHFYQKDVTGKVPEWAKTCFYYSETEKKKKQYLLVNNEETLLLMASLGAIEIHPWNSTASNPDNPTWCIIDLDPDKNSFDQVIEAALVTKQVLDSMHVPAYCKTSGSTGLHIYIPLGGKYDYEQCKEFARVIATMVQRELPEFTTIERLTANRDGKMYIDFLQNRPHATVAGPYSLRPRPGAPVSMPLHWHEIKKGLKITDFHIHNAIERMQSEGDIFKPVIGEGIDLEKIVQSL